MKFGGTSVGRPERMHQVKDLITRGDEPTIVVLSALSGTTNALVGIGEALAAGNKSLAKERIDKLHAHYLAFYPALLQTAEARGKAEEIIKEHFEFLNILLKISFNEAINRDILAQGELLSTKLFYTLLGELQIPAVFLPALDFMSIDENSEPELPKISEKLKAILAQYPNERLFITQGYICKNHRNEVDNLKRGGSDYTASLVAAAINASVCEIWTDIDGMHNNDPRHVQNTYPIRKVSFREAAELAYFGAKILHPTCVIPAENADIPIRLKNTFTPDRSGTLISRETSGHLVTAMAAKDNITAIRIRSGRMLNAFGFLRRVFEVFEKHHTSIDMITTSEVSVSLTIDDKSKLNHIITDISPFGEIQVEDDFSIISIVGDNIAKAEKLLPGIFEVLEGIPIRMVSLGGSPNTISILVPSTDKVDSLQKLDRILFHTHPLTQQKTNIQ